MAEKDETKKDEPTNADGPTPDVPELATQANLEEVAQRIESVAETTSERFDALEATLKEDHQLLVEVGQGIAQIADAPQGKGEAAYLHGLEDRIAVLEWAVEHSAGVNLAEARRRVLSPAAVETGEAGAGEDEALRGAEQP